MATINKDFRVKSGLVVESGNITTPLTTAGVVVTNSSGVLSSTATLANSYLTNSSITINGTAVSLGGSIDIVSGVASVSGTSGSIVVTGTTDPVISLATAYGDSVNPYGSKTQNYVLAAPNGSSGVPTFRALVAADIPTLNQNTTGSAGSVANALTLTADGGTTEGTSKFTFNGSAAKSLDIIAGTGISIAKAAGAWTISAPDNGTVSSVSVTSANGFAGTVATATSTPAITLSTTVTGILKGNGTALSAAIAGTDYVIPSGSITGSAGSVANAITFNTSGGAAAGTTYNGSAAKTIDYSTVGAAAASHSHGNITNSGAIGTTQDLVVVTGTSGAVTTATATNQSSSTFLRGDLTWVTPTDTNYYPTTFAWTGGTTAGPTGSLTGSGMTAVSYPAIPSAGASASGIVTTGAQTFAGTKTLTSPVITTSLTTGSTSFDLVNTTATTVNIAGAATVVNIGASTGTTTIKNDLAITGNLTVNGTTTTINSTVVNVDDILIELGAVTTPTDTTANGGGISLLGATNKTIIWDSANTNWTSSENWNLATGKVFKINNVSVLTNTTLGTSVVNSSLTKIGALSGGTAGFVKVDASGNLTSDSTTYAPLASPSLTGTVTLNSVARTVTATGTGSALFTMAGLFDKTAYNGGEFIVKLSNGTDIEIIKVMVIVSGTNFYVTQYADVQTNGAIGTVDFSLSTNNVNMTVTPASGTVTAAVTGTLLAV